LGLAARLGAVAAKHFAIDDRRRERFGILPDDRRRHMAVIGKTGMGKTTLLQHLLNSDIRAGRGVALLDPHGDLCDAVLAAVPRERTNDVILFDAADTTHPLSFNLLACPRPEQRALVASGIVSALKKLYGEFWGPRMEHILRNEAQRTEARRDLNWAYDRFACAYGPINKTTFGETSEGGVIRRMPNLVKFREDPDAILVMSLEVLPTIIACWSTK
jgi:Helicase HerA, central domain